MDLLGNVSLKREINHKDECPRLRSMDEWEVEGREVG